MGAVVELWSKVRVAPPVAYADANYLLLLYRDAHPSSKQDVRARSAHTLHEMIEAAGTQLWTTPPALDEGAWGLMRPILEREKRAAGHAGMSLARFRWKHPTDYDAALQVACVVGVKFINFVLSQTATVVRWPRRADGSVVPAARCLELARFFLRQYQIEPADALHAAYARWDYGTGGGAIISDDRQLQVITGLTVYAYAPL